MKRLSKERWAYIGIAACVLLTGAYLASAQVPASEGKIKTFQCVDTASQETVYYLDGIEEVSNNFDQWAFAHNDSVTTYIQPSGVVCTVQASINALENATADVE